MVFFILFSLLMSVGDFPAKEVYNLLDEGSILEIDEMLNKLKTFESDSRALAFTGALLTKKAGLSTTMKDKVQLFKKGSQMLEREIDKKPNEVEFRFLRLAIQENSPPILGYQNNLEEDKRMVLDNFLSLDKPLQNQIRSYSKGSKIMLQSELPN